MYDQVLTKYILIRHNKGIRHSGLHGTNVDFSIKRSAKLASAEVK